MIHILAVKPSGKYEFTMIIIYCKTMSYVRTFIHD